jgi:hypothetical protein
MKNRINILCKRQWKPLLENREKWRTLGYA